MHHPCSVHQWRQCDGASYALNYFQNDRNFLKPQVMHRLAEDGTAISELPIVYYLAAQLYKIFGFHDYYIRWLHFIIFSIGLLYITKTAMFFTRHLFLQLIPALFTLTSAYIFYYGANFLPDVPALSFAMIGFYFFVKYNRHPTLKTFLFALLFSVIGGLFKLSSLIPMMSCLAMIAIDEFKDSQRNLFKRPNKILLVIATAIGLAVLIAWVMYTKYIAATSNYEGNLLGLLPIWDGDINDIKTVGQRLQKDWLPVIMAKWSWIFMVLVAVHFMLSFKDQDKFLRRIIPLAFIGILFYIAAWFQAFNHHDYYMINLFCFPILLLFGSIHQLDKYFENSTIKVFGISILSLLLINTAYKSRAVQLDRYYGPQHSTLNEGFYSITSYLRKIGVERSDWVYSIPDPSTNNTLYFMNNPGFTFCYTQDRPLEILENPKVKYLIISDSEYVKQAPFDEYCTAANLKGVYKGIYVYKLR